MNDELLTNARVTPTVDPRCAQKGNMPLLLGDGEDMPPAALRRKTTTRKRKATTIFLSTDPMA